MDTPAEVVQWLQQKYMEVPSSVHVNTKELYELYESTFASSSDSKILSKQQIGFMVPQIFKNVKVVRHSDRGHAYQGLRLNVLEDKPCNTDEINTLASENGYFKMSTAGDSWKYGLMTGQTVNKIEVMKIIEFKHDGAFTLYIAGKEIELGLIGLANMTASTYLNVKTIFNTVKQARLCRGKIVNSKHNTKKFSNIQEWSTNGDENSTTLRQTSRKCHAVMPFTAHSDVCMHCTHQKITECEDKKKDTFDMEMTFKTMFPGAIDMMLTLLKQQSEMCKNRKDPRTRRWDKEIIQVSLTLWNRSPEGYKTLKNSGMLILPSESLLQRYKNCIQHSPGINPDMLRWLHVETERLQSEKHGGLILDEMAIQ